MKYINEYNKYGIGLILESIMEYGPEFSKIVYIISKENSGKSSIIARKIIEYIGKDVDIAMNYVDISDNNGFLKFIQDGRVDKSNVLYKVSSDAYYRSGDPNALQLFSDTTGDKAKISGDFNNTPTPDDKYKLLGTYRYPNFHDYTYMMYVIRRVGDDANFLVYTEKGKQCLFSCVDSKYSDIRTGRLIRNFLNAVKFKYTEKDIEDFVNMFYAKIDEINKELVVVSGEDIRYWYSKNNYESENGSLGSSCMRYVYCSDYFDIYTDNPDVCSLAILKNDNGKLMGRALLWTDMDGNKWMDNVYCAKDYIAHIFSNWASKNNYRKIVGGTTVSIDVNGGEYRGYPYLDSLYYYYIDKGILSNRNNLGGSYLLLTETDGEYEGPYDSN